MIFKFFVSTFLFCCTNLLSATPHTYTAKPVVSMQAEPKELSEVCSQTLYGEEVTILETAQDPSWIKIKTRDNYTGYVRQADVLTRETAYPTTEKIVRTKNLTAHIYRVKDITPFPPLLTLPCGIKLEVVSEPTDQNNRFIEVRLLDGSQGFVHRADVCVNPKRMSRKKMLQFAKQFIGLPYTWGGTSSFGFDCSGFVQFLFRHTGVELPRDAKDQILDPRMKRITLQELRPADLLFFGKTAQQGKITHVGLYLGNNRFIHSTATIGSPTIHITLLNDPKIAELGLTLIPARLGD